MSQDQYNYLFSKAKELMSKTRDPVHDWTHIERVLQNAERLLGMLKSSFKKQVDLKLLKIAICWHDISYIRYRPTLTQFLFEGLRSVRIASGYFKKVNLSKSHRLLIENLIKHHNFNDFGFLNKNKSIYHQLIQDADHADNFYEYRLGVAERFKYLTFFKWSVMSIIKPMLYSKLKHKRHNFFNLKETNTLLNSYK